MQVAVFFFRIILCTVMAINFAAVSAQDAKYYYDIGEKFSRARLNRETKYDSAIVYYSKAISLDSVFTNAYIGRGFSYIAKELVDPAITDFAKAISLAPDSSDFYSYRAEAYFKKRIYDSSITDYTNALKLMRPDDKEGSVIYYGGRYKAYYFTNQIDSALKDIDALIGIQPKFAGHYNDRGLCYNSLGEYDNSIEDFIRYLSKNNNQGNAYINIISPLARTKRFKDATFYYNLFRKKNLESFLDDSKYQFYNYFVRAVTQVADNNFTGALANLDTASGKYNSEIKDETKRLYVDILFLNGYILEKLERYDDAKVNYEQSLVIDKRQPDITEALSALENQQIVLRFNDRTGPVLVEEDLFVSEPKIIKGSDSRQFSIVSDSVKYQINGRATDESGIDSVKVNGIPVNILEEDGNFFTKITVSAGTNTLEIKIKDKKNNEIIHEYKLAGASANTEQKKEPEPEGMGKFYAILIAEKDYIDPKFSDLKFPVRDANKLRDVLINNYTFEEKNVDTLYNRSREDILQTIIARCKSLGKNDNLLIFYAGHGDTTLDIKGEPKGYLIPITALSDQVSYYINPNDINDAVYNSNAKHILILLDACYSGTFTREAGHDIDGDVLLQWKTKSRKVMTSGNLSPVPDKSAFIEYLTEFLLKNEKEFLSTKDIWPFVDSHVRAQLKNIENAKYYDPQYAPLIVAGDLGGSFIFQLKKKN